MVSGNLCDTACNICGEFVTHVYSLQIKCDVTLMFQVKILRFALSFEHVWVYWETWVCDYLLGGKITINHLFLPSLKKCLFFSKGDLIYLVMMTIITMMVIAMTPINLQHLMLNLVTQDSRGSPKQHSK